ncbi:EcsC family protein [Roseovarius mucosus]|uniref:EcsC family protein n=1 Tax=Roseovarius mucosus TaxID=215743 RepID=UPI001C5FB41F|nr:EcsC family protein [Roseovarius mucosus]MBW4973670.1 EcsC family protein [Roseovarius mucosus]
MELLGRPIDETETERRLRALVARNAQAGNGVIDLLNLVGGRAEGLLDRLPPSLRARLNETTEEALRRAAEMAHRSRGVVGDQPGWMARALTTSMGAVGGIGGLPTALAELPITVTVLLRAIQDVAAEHGFDPSEPAVRFDSVQVFGAAGPLERDDGANLGFLGSRMTVTGPGLNALIARVAPRLAAVLGQKLAAQTVPILGAAAGAATNYAYTRYYQDMAQVHFGLRRLAIDAGRDHSALCAEFRAMAQSTPGRVS